MAVKRNIVNFIRPLHMLMPLQKEGEKVVRPSKKDIIILDEIKAFIEKNISVRYTREELAKSFSQESKKYITPYFIKKYFKPYFKKNLLELIKELRMEKAPSLVLDDSKKLDEVAKVLGMNRTTLSIEFKKYHDMTITEYREIHSTK